MRWKSHQRLLIEWDAERAWAWRAERVEGVWEIVAEAHADVGADPAVALRACVRELSASRVPVISLFPGSEVMVRRIELPPNVSEDALDAVMDHELARHLPLSPSLFACDYHAIATTPDQTSVLLAAVRRNILDRHLEVLERANLKPLRVLPTTLAFAAGLSYQSGDWCAIHARAHLVDILLFRESLLQQARSFDPRRSDAAHEVANTINLYLRKQELEALSHCFCFGPERAWQQTLAGLPIEASRLISSETPESTGACRATFDLRHQLLREARRTRQHSIRRGWIQAIPLALTLLLSAGFFGLQSMREGYEARADARAEQLETIRRRRLSIRKLQRQLTSLQEQRQSFRWLEERYPTLAGRLYEVGARLPETIWLEGISTPEMAASRRKRLTQPLPVATIRVTGFAATQTEIDALAQELASAEAIQQVVQESSEPKTIREQRWLRFTLALRSEHLEGMVHIHPIGADTTAGEK